MLLLASLQPDATSALTTSSILASNDPGSSTWLVYLPFASRGDQRALDGRPSWGAPIAISPLDGAVWVVNPDSASVTRVDPGGVGTPREIVVGREPWSLVIAPAGDLIFVVNRADGAVAVVDAHRHRLRATVPVGPEPGAIALSPSGGTAYVTVTSADYVAVIDTARLTVTAQIPVAALPLAIAVTNDGDGDDNDERLLVTHLLALPQAGGAEASDDGRAGRITVIDSGTITVTNVITLAPDEHGFPNLLSAISLAATRAWVPHVRAAPALPNGLTTTVFAAVDTLDLAGESVAEGERLLLNDQDVFGSPVNNPVAAIPAPDGKSLYVVLAGSNLVERVDLSNPRQPRLGKFMPTGHNPRGIAISADGQRGYVMNYLGRSVSVLDLSEQTLIAEISITGESLAPDVLRGKILFNSAADPRLSQGSWISCASCHPDAGADGVTWVFPDGPRQTPPLWNATQTLPWHWSAALDEAQDVEETIHLIQHGLGLAPGADPAQLGAPNAGRSSDLDALAAFIRLGVRTPAVAEARGAATAGRDLFVAAGCVTCHGGANWTISQLAGPVGELDRDEDGMVNAVLRAVGTLNPADVRGATGFDVPALLNVALTRPYLHDGSMPTLAALLAAGHPDPQGGGNGLTADEQAALVIFLRSIGPQTAPVAMQR